MNLSKDVWKRIARTAVMTFIAAYGGTNLINALGGSTNFDPTLLRSAGAAALVAVVSALWNIFLDPSPVPSLAPSSEE